MKKAESFKYLSKTAQVSLNVENIVATVEPANRKVEVADSPVKAANPTFEPANGTVRMADLTFEVSHSPLREFNPPVEQPNPTVEPADAAATKLNSPFEAADLAVQVSYPQVQPVKTTSDDFFSAARPGKLTAVKFHSKNLKTVAAFRFRHFNAAVVA